MKKKLLTIISLLVALVMCFTLAACGPKTNGGDPSDDPNDNPNDNPNDDPTDDPANEADKFFAKLSSAVTSFYSNEGYEITVDGTATSEYMGSAEFSDSFKRAGDWLVIGGDENSVESYYNIETGYAYTPLYVNDEFAGYTFSAGLPVGFVDYLSEAMENIMQFDAAVASDTAITMPEFVNITYNEDTSTATVKIDVTETANTLTAPLRNNYAEGSLADVINDYLDIVAPGLTLDTVVDTVKSLAIDNKNTTVGQLADILGTVAGIEDLSGQFESILLDSGLEQAQINAIMNRTLAEMIMGAIQGMTEEVPADELPYAILTAAFFAEVDITGYEDAIDQFATVIKTMLQGTNFRDSVDPTTAFGAFVAGNVEFTDLSAEFTVTFDAQERISAMTLDIGMAHNASDEDFAEGSFFADNNYTLNLEVEISEYNASVEFEPEIEFYSDPSMVSYVPVIAQSGKDVSVYIELGGVEASAIGDEIGVSITAQAGEVVFDKTTSILTVKSSLLDDPEINNVLVTINVTRNGVADPMIVYIMKAPAVEGITMIDLITVFSTIVSAPSFGANG